MAPFLFSFHPLYKSNRLYFSHCHGRLNYFASTEARSNLSSRAINLQSTPGGWLATHFAAVTNTDRVSGFQFILQPCLVLGLHRANLSIMSSEQIKKSISICAPSPVAYTAVKAVGSFSILQDRLK
jgi:hypothetical protein